MSPIKQPHTSLEDFIDSLDFQTASHPPIQQETLFDEIDGMSFESFSEEPQISLEDFIDFVETATYPPIKQETLFDESNGMSFNEEPQESLQDSIDSTYPMIKQETLFDASNEMSLESFIPTTLDHPPPQPFEASIQPQVSLEPCGDSLTREESAYDKSVASELFKLVNELLTFN